MKARQQAREMERNHVGCVIVRISRGLGDRLASIVPNDLAAGSVRADN
jgi:hypothetical protein